jgi:hypothetical protein
MDGDQPQVVDKDGERGRNRTFNLLIKSYVSQCGYRIDNSSRHHNLTITRPAWTVFESVGKVGEIERHLIEKDTKRSQRTKPIVRHGNRSFSPVGIVVKGLPTVVRN